MEHLESWKARTVPALRRYTAMTTPRTFSIDADGRTYNASWTVEGGQLHVASAYGSDQVAVGRAKPEILAQRLLRAIVARQRK